MKEITHLLFKTGAPENKGDDSWGKIRSSACACPTNA